MPSLYAHYRFGNMILPSLPADVRGAIMRHPELFDAGLQGPDFFFYYKPTSKTRIGDLGSQTHQLTGREFFSRACEKLDLSSGEAEQVYLYGLLGHYCLDSLCHPYVCALADQGIAGHNAIESELERHLLLLDGVKRPHAYPRARLLKLKKEDFSLISRFYPPAAPEQIREAVSAAKQITSLITCANPLHRLAATAVLRGLGNERIGLMIPQKSNPALAESNEKLQSLFNQALALYPSLLEQLRDYLSFREPFGEDFNRIFG